ncbi:MAG: pyridoxal 5'-phosphate synthase glutaminase subunit PdxT [Nitrososphaerales archaeon]
MKVGVLGFQGNIEEHLLATKLAMRNKGIEGEASIIKRPREVDEIDGLIIPGGESTVMGILGSFNGVLNRIKERAMEGLPIMGTCAGLIMMAKRTYDRVVGETHQPLLGILNVMVERNSFGRQRESFELPLKIPVLGNKDFPGVFIRAPSIKECYEGVEVLCMLREHIVGVKQGKLLGLAFHPELSGDLRLHEYFLDLI